MRRKVTATYRVINDPARDGQRIWIDLTIENRSDVRLWVDTSGELIVTRPSKPRRPPSIEWGGSSADGMIVGKNSTASKPIYDIAGGKLAAHSDSRVALIGVSTILAPYVRATYDCRLPAQMRAPSGLVTAHPDGTWFLTAREGERIRIEGFHQMLDQ